MAKASRDNARNYATLERIERKLDFLIENLLDEDARKKLKKVVEPAGKKPTKTYAGETAPEQVAAPAANKNLSARERRQAEREAERAAREAEAEQAEPTEETAEEAA